MRFDVFGCTEFSGQYGWLNLALHSLEVLKPVQKKTADQQTAQYSLRRQVGRERSWAETLSVGLYVTHM